ncbi:hypothetical protein A9Q99_15470 [Gammaproteobacteria bacterium 45_16_T64]|nr:hypothetical protein A9Q99_15470 [Gammaproteobacteria bacterium 45_16_T64]
MIKHLVIMIFGCCTIFSVYGASSILESGKSTREIAEEILSGARNRYAREQIELNRVVMYSTSWCGYCAKARSYFNSKGIKFRDLDIEKNRNAKNAYDKLNGSGVPLIVVGGKVIRGFNRTKFERLYRELH